jgi:hypothetical protein
MRAARIFNAAGFALLWGFTLALVLIWDQNIFSIMALALGIAATLLFAFNLKWRRAVAATASALFVVNWALAFAFTQSGAPLLETYWSVLRTAMRSSNFADAAVVLAYEAALPLLHLIASVSLSVSLLRSRAVD